MGFCLLRSLQLLLLFAIVAVRAALTINWPATIVQNSQAPITWEGQAPFDFAVFSVNNSTNVNTQIFQLLNTNDTGVQWSPNVAPGTTVFFFVSDNTAAFVQSDDVVVSPLGGSQSTATSTTPISTPVSTARSTTTSSATPAASTTSSTKPSFTSTTPTTTSTIFPSSTTLTPSTTSSLADNSTSTPSPSPYTQPSMSADRSVPFIVGTISGIVVLVIILVAIRFFLKRRRRRQEAAALAARQMAYWNPKPGNQGGFDMEKGSSGTVTKEKGKGSSSLENVSSSDRASASSDDLLLRRNAAGSILPLHATPVRSQSPQPRSVTLNPSPETASPMLPNPFADYNNVQYKNANSSNGDSVGKASHSSTALTNARASSVFLPLNDGYEDVDLDAGPSTLGSQAPRSLAQAQSYGMSNAPSSWRVGQIVSQHGELMPSPTAGNAPKSAHPIHGESSFRSAHTARTNSSNGRGALSSSLVSRGSAPASPSPFDDVVFDLGALPPQTITPLGRNVSTKTTRVRRRNGNGALAGERSPAGNFPSDANDDDDDVDDFEYDLPTPRDASIYSIASTSTAGPSGTGRAHQEIPPVPPLNIAKMTGTADVNQQRQQHHRSAIPSPPHDSDSILEDLPSVPMTAQSDGDYVRSMLADVFGPEAGNGVRGPEREQEPSLPTPKATVVPRTDSIYSSRGDGSSNVKATTSTTQTTSTPNGSPSRRPRPNWI